MERFAELFNKLQSVINIVGTDIAFPQIVVVGSQSDGKSSVLESIVQQGFLPRGTGVVTRTPIILQLRHEEIRGESDGTEEYAEVSYEAPGSTSGQNIITKSITDFRQVAPEISQATDVLAGGKKNIVDKPITVKLYSPHVPDLTLVDLPGLVENRAGDQPMDIKEQVEQLVRSYIENPSAIILAVHPATTDLANGKSLNFAREVDPEGKRTLCVVTKLDLVGSGVDKTELLNGNEIAYHHAKVLRTIGVINATAADQSKPNWTHADQVRKEDAYLRQHFRRIASEHGTTVLTDYLALLFREHIRKSLPKLKAAVDEMVSQHQSDLSALGEDIRTKVKEERDPNQPDPEHALVVKIVGDFVNYFKGALVGDIDQGAKEVKGGARIEEVFNETYWNALGAIIPLENTSEMEAFTQIRNSWGVERQMFLSIKAFGILVRNEMDRMEEQSIRCVTLAHQELLTIRNSAGQHIAFLTLRNQLRRKDAQWYNVGHVARKAYDNLVDGWLNFQRIKEQYPKLYERINDIVAKFMEAQLDNTKAMVHHCVKMQLDYLNVKHPDFAKAQFDAMKRFNEIAALVDQSQEDGSTNVSGNASGIIGRPAPHPPGLPSGTKPRPVLTFPDDDEPEPNGNVSSRPPPQVLSKPRTLTKREKLECEITMELVRQYFDFIRRIVRDSVPKVIMRFLVNQVKNEIQGELLTQLGPREAFVSLLQESEIMAKKRSNLTEKVDLYRNAATLIRELEAS